MIDLYMLFNIFVSEAPHTGMPGEVFAIWKGAIIIFLSDM